MISKSKVVRPGNLHIEVWKSLGDIGIEWLTKIFNKIIRLKQMTDE